MSLSVVCARSRLGLNPRIEAGRLFPSRREDLPPPPCATNFHFLFQSRQVPYYRKGDSKMLTDRQLWIDSEEDRKIKAKALLIQLSDDSHRAEAAKTIQLRALRLAKEAGEKDVAVHAMAAKTDNAKRVR